MNKFYIVYSELFEGMLSSIEQLYDLMHCDSDEVIRNDTSDLKPIIMNYRFNEFDGIVYNTNTDETIFETNDIQDTRVVDVVVTLLNVDKDVMAIDTYLLNEDRCTQEEREIIIEGISRGY